MMQKLRHRAGNLLLALRFSLSARQRERVLRRRETLPVVRGNMRRVIVVEPPDPMFSEAMFILRDDYFQTPGLSRQELLRQAQKVAQDFVGTAEPPEPRQPIFPTAMSVFALGAAAAILALWIGGVI
ncbi:MAG: hypothetical protein ACI4O0_02545 [Candidatus Limivicinus sp.]